MNYRFYTTSKRALGAMLTAINEAQESIYLEMYILESDPTGNDFISVLKRKAAEGLRVIVVLDSIGSFGVNMAKIERLRSSGAEVVFFSHWFKRTHRKILIIDEHVVFMGGVNISGRFAPWKDLQVRITGIRMGQNAIRSFARVYQQCGGRDPYLLERASLPLLKRARLWFQEHGVNPKHRSLRRYYEEHISRAKHSITLITPYLVPNRWLIAHLHDAILRGVSVEIIVPQHTDHVFIDHVNTYYLDLFSGIGATCRLGRTMNHAKVMLIDGQEGTIGSQNLDALSFDWNVEASIFFDSLAMVRDLKTIIEKWRNDSDFFMPKKNKTTPLHTLFGIFLRIFRPIL